ncbi:MAG: hypothetical protein NZ869_06255, partial [Thermoanaerobaculum sp.]|nr:hypothetical protein [Thermoanaerobaculum sp.]MDW7968380.1 hypothetical protein [Thermoanaerobaculum sp.]
MGREKALKIALLVLPPLLAWWSKSPTAPAPHPREAAKRAEGQSPSLGLVWGKLRAFTRQGEAWELIYQPAHGAWLVSVLVPDLDAPGRPALTAAPWLPGSRLSLAAAGFLAGGGEAVGYWERPARRDWLWSTGSVVGGLAAGTPRSPTHPPWASWPFLVMVSLFLAGAVGRRLLAMPATAGLRRWVLWACVLLLPACIGLARLWGPLFAAGVRPFISLLLFQVACLLVLGGAAVGLYIFPVFAQKPAFWPVALGFTGGWLAGFSLAPPWTAALAAVPWRWALLVAGPVIAGYLLDLAATGARILLSPLRRWAGWVAGGLAGVSLWWGGDWGWVLAVLLLFVLWPHGQSFWLAVAVPAGFIPRAWLAGVGWWGP